MRRPGKALIAAAFREMGEFLLQEGKVAEVAVHGGGAIILQFTVTFRAGGVAVGVETGAHGAVMRAARKVAACRGWRRTWFREAVADCVAAAGGTALHASYPDEGQAGLRVYVAKPDYLLAMLLRAMRVGTRDAEDAVTLARASGITTTAAMLDLLDKFFPSDLPDPRRVAILAQFAVHLHASPSEHAG